MLMEAALFKAIRYSGNQRRLATLLGVKPDKISFWLNRAKTIPFEYALAIEKVTNGLVSCYDLAPYARSRPYHFSPIKKVMTPPELKISERASLGIITEIIYKDKQHKQKKPSHKPLEYTYIKAIRKTSRLIARQAGFSSQDSYLRAKKVVMYGIQKLIEAMDKRIISITHAAQIAALSPQEQEKFLMKNKYQFKQPHAYLLEEIKK